MAIGGVVVDDVPAILYCGATVVFLCVVGWWHASDDYNNKKRGTRILFSFANEEKGKAALFKCIFFLSKKRNRTPSSALVLTAVSKYITIISHPSRSGTEGRYASQPRHDMTIRLRNTIPRSIFTKRKSPEKKIKLQECPPSVAPPI